MKAWFLANRRHFLKGIGSQALLLLLGSKARSQTDPPRNEVDTGAAKKFLWPRLSSPQAELFDHSSSDSQEGEASSASLKPFIYDVVVVGSGYGSSVFIETLGRNFDLQQCHVAILERGAEFQPGDFPSLPEPRTLWQRLLARTTEPSKNIFTTLRTYLPRIHFNPLGMWEVNPGGDVDVITGNALGGGSNINAGVLLRARPEILNQPAFTDLGLSYSDLLPYYKKVERLLAAEVYETNNEFQVDYVNSEPDYKDFLMGSKDRRPDFHLSRKYEFLKWSSQKIKEVDSSATFYAPPLAVNLTRFNQQLNESGVQQFQCTQCGDCITGCNVGAKNTLIMNYLPRAKKAGAKIFTGIEVKFIGKENEYYKIAIIKHDLTNLGQPLSGTFEPSKKSYIFAKSVVLGAGAVGSTRILNESQKMGTLALSKRLGLGFSANGDSISFGYNGKTFFGKSPSNLLNIFGFGAKPSTLVDNLTLLDPVGPTISGCIEVQQTETKRLLIQDAAIPSVFVSPVRTLLNNIVNFVFDRRQWSADQERALRVDRNPDLGYLASLQGALNRTFIFLGIADDSNNGRIRFDTFEEGRAKVEYTRDVSPQQLIAQRHGRSQSEFIAREFGAYAVANPRLHSALASGPNGTIVSVHPLGGCALGRDRNQGVTSPLGEVFDGSLQEDPAMDNETHKNLFVVCGSVAPAAYGRNPLLTISAISSLLTERMIGAGRFDYLPKRNDPL